MTRQLILSLIFIFVAAVYAYLIQPGRFPSTGGSYTPRDELIQMNGG